MSVIGHALLFTPIIDLLSFIPLIGHLLKYVIGFAAFVFAFIWASCLHCIIMGVSWFVYRPVYGIIALCVVVSSIVIVVLVGKN